ncbi:MAG: hypothetical protein GC179_28425 [Anaerolineaceae bacterium]|nr:hypothetical protein [Anaerolineaceae bacterium]
MANRIKTLLEYGGAEWRSDLKLGLLTLFCCALTIIFFDSDNLLGAVLLQTIYFRYGMIVALVLLASLVFIFMKWIGIPFIGKVLGVVLFIVVASPFLANESLVFVVTYFLSFIFGIGAIFFVPAAIVAWIGVAVFACLRGWLSDYLTEPLLVRVIIICSLTLTSFYISFRYIQSLDFAVIEHQQIGADHFYTINKTSLSSGISSNIVHYKCNSISIGCMEVSE